MRRFSLGVALGFVGVALVMQLAPPNDLAPAVAAIALVAFVAGVVAARAGAVVGALSVLVGWLAWLGGSFADSWVRGTLTLTGPGCDPCGIAGYAGRLAVVAALMAVVFGAPAAASGWLGEFTQRRG